VEPRPDVLTLKRIYEAERQADRIVRDAEAEAAELLRKADAEAAEILDARRQGISRWRSEALEEAISRIEGEAGALREREQARTEQQSRRRRAEIDATVERLLEMVLPS
jgi:vacuolar-type H+-ATPase subunit H